MTVINATPQVGSVTLTVRCLLAYLSIDNGPGSGRRTACTHAHAAIRIACIMPKSRDIRYWVPPILRFGLHSIPVIPWYAAVASTLLPFLVAPQVFGELPVAEKPRVFIDTNYRHPSGTTRFAGTSADLQAVLYAAQPGDTIVLDAGVLYSGNFTLPVKNNPSHRWIYIESSAVSKLPAPGKRVSPSDAVNMPKIVTPNVKSAVTLPPGASYYRLVGLEIYSASTEGCNPKVSPPANCFSYMLVNGATAIGKPLVDSITVDRCYVHGSPTQDVIHAVVANGSNFAVVDSEISDLHGYQVDSQAILSYLGTGPIKIVNNELVALGENVMFGGAGGENNPWVPSDIEIRNNHFYVPAKFRAIGLTVGASAWKVKNHLEFKTGRRVLVDGNTFENMWASAQTGSSVLFNPRPNQSGPLAVVDDVAFSNNHLKGIVQGIQGSPNDPNCCPTCACTAPGEAKRINIVNNLIEMGDNTGVGGYNSPISLLAQDGITDWVWQHNTIVPPPGKSYCAWSLFFNSHGFVQTRSSTHNVWVLGNVLCRQPSGNGGGQGTAGLTAYMGDPSPLAPRYAGNVMLLANSDRPQSFPPGNVSTSAGSVFKDPVNGNFELLSPTKARTADGAPAGVDMSKIQAAIAPVAVPPARVQPEVVVLRPTETAEFHTSAGSSPWRLTPKIGSITSTGLYTAPANLKEPAGVTLCSTDAESLDVCASIVLLPAVRDSRTSVPQ